MYVHETNHMKFLKVNKIINILKSAFTLDVMHFNVKCTNIILVIKFTSHENFMLS